MANNTIHTLELGLIYEEQGYHEKAREHFAGALKKDPENKTLVEGLERVSAREKERKTEVDNFSDLSRLSTLAEEWVSLVFLKRRLASFGYRSGKSI